MDCGRALLLGLAFVGVGCSTDTDMTDRPLFDNGVNVFEAQVFDGLTGARVEEATVSVQVGRHVLEARDDEGLLTVYGIPYGTFRVSARAAGYADFQAMKAFTDSSSHASLSHGDPLVYYFNNIVMYPEGTVPQGIVVSVYDGSDGTPVPDATVLAALESVGAPVPVASILAPNVGLLPTTLGATTGADGKATLQADSLVMGGTYEIHVYGALDADGVYLVPEYNEHVTVGEELQEVIVFLSRPYLYPVALWANNEDAQLLTTLEVKFPYAIDVCSSSSSHSWYNSTVPVDTNSNGVWGMPAATDPVTVTLGQNDSLLTLAFAQDPLSIDPADALDVTFTGVSVRPTGSSDSSCTSLTNVLLRSTSAGPTVDTEIHVRDVP